MQKQYIHYSSPAHAARAAAVFNTAAVPAITARADGNTVVITPSAVLLRLQVGLRNH